MFVDHGGLVAAALPLLRETVNNSNTTSRSGGIFIIPNYTFFAELVLFVIVLGIMAKWILPPIQQALDERQTRVRGALQAADEGRVESERLEREREAVLNRARSEARELLDEARQRAEQVREAARRRADAERAHRLAEALARFEAERPLLRAEAMGGVERLVGDAATQVLGSPIDLSRHTGVVEAAVEAVASAGASASGGRVE